MGRTSAKRPCFSHKKSPAVNRAKAGGNRFSRGRVEPAYAGAVTNQAFGESLRGLAAAPWIYVVREGRREVAPYLASLQLASKPPRVDDIDCWNWNPWLASNQLTCLLHKHASSRFHMLPLAVPTNYTIKDILRRFPFRLTRPSAFGNCNEFSPLLFPSPCFTWRGCARSN